MTKAIKQDVMHQAERPASSADVIAYATATCALGRDLMARSTSGVCAIAFGDSDADLVADLIRRFPRSVLMHSPAMTEADMAAICDAVDHPRAGLTLELDLRGTPFQQRVWQVLRAVPAGHTVSYAELARQISPHTHPRAVAGACAANPIALAVPCHRVVSSTGALSGYRWGVWRKQELLQREAMA